MRAVPPASPLVARCAGALAVAAMVVGVGWLASAAAAQQEEAPDLGAHLYGRDCASCHGAAGEGTARGVPIAESGAAGAHFYVSTGRMPIDEPSDEIRRRPPAYTADEIDALVDHVAGFGDGPAVPHVDPDGGDLGEGGTLFRLHCAQCHGASGVGTALAFGVIAPDVLAASPTQVAESLVVGPGAMPTFAPDVLSSEQVDAVVRYVARLQEPEDRGGLPLARSGRLDELAVAWGVGVALLLAGLRWIARGR